MLKKLERFTCFLAALLALVVEACLVYALRMHPRVTAPVNSIPYGGEWMGPTLPQCWLVGALVALLYYLLHAWRVNEGLALPRRRAFLRTWCWFLALASAHGCALCLGYFVGVRR
jgi:hypothetical protein